MNAATRSVLFYRDFRVFSGGDLKVWDYFNHVRESSRYQALIHFSPQSVWNESNPWRDMKASVVPSWNEVHPDILFLGGTDWRMLDEAERGRYRVPVVNIIQGVRHAAPDDERYPFLRYRAIRIFLSEAVAEPVRASGQVNGPIVVIPNGMDTRGMPGALPQSEKDIDILISALKQPALGAQLQQALAEPQRRVELLPSQLPRPEYVALLNRARIVLHLPSFVGGFCLPALEAMALDALLVCPDCIGNRSLCLPGHNCFRPDYDAHSLLRDTNAALRLSPERAAEMRRNARATVAQHTLTAERARFIELLDNVDQLW